MERIAGSHLGQESSARPRGTYRKGDRGIAAGLAVKGPALTGGSADHGVGGRIDRWADEAFTWHGKDGIIAAFAFWGGIRYIVDTSEQEERFGKVHLNNNWNINYSAGIRAS